MEEKKREEREREVRLLLTSSSLFSWLPSAIHLSLLPSSNTHGRESYSFAPLARIIKTDGTINGEDLGEEREDTACHENPTLSLFASAAIGSNSPLYRVIYSDFMKRTP